MHDEKSPALEVAMAYYQAWTNKDLDLAMSYLAPDIVCDAPAGRIKGVDAYREFLGPFAQMLINAQLIAAFGDKDQAMIMMTRRRPWSTADPAPNASQSRTTRLPTVVSSSTAPV